MLPHKISADHSVLSRPVYSLTWAVRGMDASSVRQVRAVTSPAARTTSLPMS